MEKTIDLTVYCKVLKRKDGSGTFTSYYTYIDKKPYSVRFVRGYSEPLSTKTSMRAQCSFTQVNGYPTIYVREWVNNE